MRITGRRRLDAGLMVGGSLAVGAVSLVGAVAGDSERVERLWTSAELADDGSAQVTEQIDYDFGSGLTANDKHGIFRYVWDLSPEAPITVDSPDAPDAIEVTPAVRDGRSGANIRIGDPNTTVSGRHRYRIDYPLPGVARGTTLDWEAVGVGWEVGIADAEIHVVAPFVLLDPICSQGFTGSQGGCEVREVEPGHLVATVDGLDSGEGVSIEARTGSDLASPPAPPEPPAAAPDDPGTGLLPPAGTAAAGALLAAGPTALLVRRAGRERVGAGGPADTAWGGSASPFADGPGPGDGRPRPGGTASSISWVRVDQEELESMATTEFAPPAELEPAHGGIVLTEEVRPEHKVAWLIQMAIDGTVDIGTNGSEPGGPEGGVGVRVPGARAGAGGDDLRLVRTGHGPSDAAAILDTAFAGRDEIELGRYDPAFARAWSQLQGQLLGWRETSGMWDPGGTRKAATRVLGIVGVVVGALGAGAGGALANQWGPAWLALSAVGGAVAGAGLAAALRAWELRVRTPAGSAAWLRVESFRRFLAASEAYHAEEAAKRGVLREYTAWAVAVGEIDRWRRAVSAASIAPQTAGLSYAYMAPVLLASTTSAATAPASTGGGGGGGFGGGSVGGGAGGGGVGSW
jgi:hypothetical protein